jgi:thiol-disulfide isomerase/thioredoxin
VSSGKSFLDEGVAHRSDSRISILAFRASAALTALRLFKAVLKRLSGSRISILPALAPSPAGLALLLLGLASFLVVQAEAAGGARQGRNSVTTKKEALAPLPPLLDRQGYARLIANHRGRVVLVDFWATWCEPCRQEFAWLKELERRYRDRGLVVLAVSVDIPSAYPQVRKFLGQQQPRFSTYLKKPGDDEAFINAVDADWSGTLPATFVYDATGKRVRSLFGEQTPESFEAVVREFLPRAPGADQHSP